MSASIDGIVTGLDTTAIIEASVNVASIPKFFMERQLEEAEDRKDKVAGLMNRLEELSTAIADMDTEGEMVSMTASISEEGQFTAEADADAVQGTYNILVNRLASAETEASDGFADISSTGIIDEGTYTLTYAGVGTDVTIDSSNSSLVELASAFDAIDGITAYIIDTADGSGSPYRLVVQGEDTGDDNTIEITTSGMAGTATEPTFTEAATAADAWATINGMEVYSDTNRITGIQGLTLDLDATGTSAVTLNVERDLDALEETIQGFVDTYNEVRTYYDTHNAYDADAEIKGALNGDTVARRAVDRLGDIISSQYVLTESTFETLSMLGIATQSDGSIELDAETLQDALTDDFDEVMGILTSEDGPLVALRDTIDDVLVDSENGILVSRQDSLQDQIDGLNDRIDDYDRYLDNMTDRLKHRFTELEVAMGTMQSTQGYLSALFGF